MLSFPKSELHSGCPYKLLLGRNKLILYLKYKTSRIGVVYPKSSVFLLPRASWVALAIWQGKQVQTVFTQPGHWTHRPQVLACHLHYQGSLSRGPNGLYMIREWLADLAKPGANRYTKLEKLAWSHSVFIQFTLCIKHKFMKPLILEDYQKIIPNWV